MRAQRVYGLGDKSEPVQVDLGPAGADEEIANDVGRKGIIGPMVMIHHKPTIGVAVDKLTPLAFSASKTLVFEGSNDAADPRQLHRSAIGGWS